MNQQQQQHTKTTNLPSVGHQIGPATFVRVQVALIIISGVVDRQLFDIMRGVTERWRMGRQWPYLIIVINPGNASPLYQQLLLYSLSLAVEKLIGRKVIRVRVRYCRIFGAHFLYAVDKVFNWFGCSNDFIVLCKKWQKLKKKYEKFWTLIIKTDSWCVAYKRFMASQKGVVLKFGLVSSYLIVVNLI